MLELNLSISIDLYKLKEWLKKLLKFKELSINSSIIQTMIKELKISKIKIKNWKNN